MKTSVAHLVPLLLLVVFNSQALGARPVNQPSGSSAPAKSIGARIKQKKFRVFIHKRLMHVVMPKVEGAISEQTLKEHGADIQGLKDAFKRIVETMGMERSKDFKIQYIGPDPDIPGADYVISDVPRGDPRFDYFQVNVFDGQIYMSYYDRVGRISGESAKGLRIDWEEFGRAISDLQSAFVGERVIAKLSRPKPERTASSFVLRYKLYKVTEP